MTTAAAAAREFATGPQVIQAARLLLDRFPLVALCEALSTAGEEDAGYLLTALERLAEFEEVRETLLSDEIVGFLRQGAEAPDPQVRALVSKLIARLASGSEDTAKRLADLGLLCACESLLLVEETGSAEAAAGVLKAAVSWPGSRPAALEATERLLEQLPKLDDTQRIRALSLFVELGRASEEAFAALEARGAYTQVLNAFFTDDILLKLNAVELMDSLGSYPAGQELLSRSGIPEKLVRELEDPYCDVSVRTCVIRLLGLVLRRCPDTMAVLLPNREAPLAQAVAGLLESRDPTERLAGLNAWANISRHPSGLAFFLQWEGRLQAILGHVSSTQNEVCKGAIACWAAVMEDREPPPESASTPGLELAPELELWKVAEERLLPLVLKVLEGKPFPDVRFHVWNLSALLVRSRTAAYQMVPSAQLRELLLDFSSESNSDARIAKHTFVKALLKHEDWLRQYLDESVADMLAEYARQGPHWVPRTAKALVGDQAA